MPSAMPSTNISKPAAVRTADCDSTEPSPRRSIKRSADAAPTRTPPRTSARRSAAQRHAGSESEDDDASSSSASVAELTPPPLSLQSPAVDTPASATSPERKIWMRPCNDCGFELHVRRVRCTSCGAVQMSKRAFAAAQEEKLRTDDRANVEAKATEAKQVRVTAEAQEAASQLALIAEASSDVSAAPAATGAAAAATSSISPTSPVASSPSVVSALARLTPEQLTKLRRMQKLRALLNKLPPGVKLPPRPAQRSSQASDAAPATSDAISMLASVACM